MPFKKNGVITLWGIGGLSQSKITGSKEPEKWIYSENRANMKFQYDMGATGISLLL